MSGRLFRDATMTEEQLRKKTRTEMTDGLSEREIAFCEFYIGDYNATMAAIKAGYKSINEKMVSRSVKNKEGVANYIAWLKLRVYDKALVNADDILSMYAKYAFYNIKDYFDYEDGRVKLKDFSKIDGQVIQEVIQKPSGEIVVKFPDRLKSLQRLENYMDVNPYDWRRRLEEKKVELLEERLEIEKSKVGLFETIEDDGFIEALEKATNNFSLDDIEDEMSEL